MSLKCDKLHEILIESIDKQSIKRDCDMYYKMS